MLSTDGGHFFDVVSVVSLLSLIVNIRSVQKKKEKESQGLMSDTQTMGKFFIYM